MAKNSEITRPYFSHDNDARSDDKILKLLFTFRKLAKEMPKEELESFVPLGAYSIFWAICEYMHRNGFRECDIEILADDLRIDTKYLNTVLGEFELFRKDNDEYVSDRMLRDLERVEIKSRQNRRAVGARWLISTFDKTYAEFFGAKPQLSTEEIDTLKKYSEQIEDLREKLPDILYTLRNLKFETDTKFTPSANWLLKGNNLLRLYNGEFGKLMHKATKQELKKQEEKQALSQQDLLDLDEIEKQKELGNIQDKTQALNFITKKAYTLGGKIFVPPHLKILLEKFGITQQDIKAYIDEKKNT